ncbi:TPA: class II aldolase/adducin family protein [Burkholderia multivorans]|uniref:class II aldolase/adducin family protein n=1 Tax=Burkholderia multivorans TaxID=87883 RepID=UPI002019B5F4|nr:class II aldolase/adducin family protein [Burkholderia multivorans]MCO1459909.1 class II aldolase/adducin family protein [Burkholderia multivorans]UQO21320.1 class II aldolase/adducin family protein [Burkholderia multivorans]HEM7842895.1 class II aldolase/adducin family protein [Burkholderia multivorans]HEM7908280.1 class II aldolase/adducin family protein [Burkholderia multivorans]HEM8539405.1 class II aldolase/adducin family protein [Burkholderia multivorans]
MQTRRAADAFPVKEWQARCDLAAAYRLAAANGWHDMFGTHFSLRVPGTTDQYLVNPAGYFFEEITASSLVRIDTHGAVLSESEHGINPAAARIHGAIFSARPEIGAVMHLHSVAGTGVSIQKAGLMPISQSAVILSSRVRYYDYGGADLDDAEQQKLVHALGDGSVLFMRNHGTLTAGRTIGEAFALMTRLERACQIQLAAQLSDDITEIPLALREELVLLGTRIYSTDSWSPAAKLEWAAFRRKADRDFPDYAT